MIKKDKVCRILIGCGLCLFSTALFCNAIFGKNSSKSNILSVDKSVNYQKLTQKTGENSSNSKKVKNTTSERADNKICSNVTQKSDSKSAKVNINTASSTEIADNLRGIGPSKSQKIVEYRQKYGNFLSIDEIKNIKGIGEKTFENVKDFITV